MVPSPGLRVGPYFLISPIGEGGMGVVWKARDSALDRDVAIKFLPPALARDPVRLARFEREAKAAASVSHPGILAVYGFGEQDGSAYAVTELLEGRTLREALAGGTLSGREALDLARQIARGLAAAHDRGIVHRDLKPENIFLTRDGHAKILDFGLAYVVGAEGPEEDRSTTPTRTSLTTPGTVLGTTNYLSPEQVRGLAVNARSDVFSFGVVLYEMFAHRRPVERETPAETMTAILRDDPELGAPLPPLLVAVVRRCLAKAPGARFASAREIADALDTPAGPASGGRRTRTVAGLAAAGALVALAAAVAIWKGRAPIGGAGTATGPPPASLSSIGEAPSRNAEANEYFEKGLLFLRAQLDLPRAQRMLDRAIEIDPTFGSARAMRSLSDLIAIHEGFVSDGGLLYAGEREMRDVIDGQPGLASAHATLGALLLYLNRKEQARTELEAALRLNPQSQPGLAWRTIADRLSGRPQEAEARARRILEGVPLFWAARIILSDILFDQGRVDDAHREIEKVFEQDAANLGAIRAMARVHVYQGDLAGARRMLEAIGAASHPNARVRLVWALVLARGGNADGAVAALDAPTLKYAEIGMFAQAQVAEIYALAGRSAEAMDWLDRAVRSGDERSGWLRQDAFLDGVRTHPRFALILDAIERGKR